VTNTESQGLISIYAYLDRLRWVGLAPAEEMGDKVRVLHDDGIGSGMETRARSASNYATGSEMDGHGVVETQPGFAGQGMVNHIHAVWCALDSFGVTISRPMSLVHLTVDELLETLFRLTLLLYPEALTPGSVDLASKVEFVLRQFTNTRAKAAEDPNARAEGESQAMLGAWRDIWSSLGFAHWPGARVWESGVLRVLHTHFASVSAVLASFTNATALSRLRALVLPPTSWAHAAELLGLARADADAIMKLVLAELPTGCEDDEHGLSLIELIHVIVWNVLPHSTRPQLTLDLMRGARIATEEKWAGLGLAKKFGGKDNRVVLDAGLEEVPAKLEMLLASSAASLVKPLGPRLRLLVDDGELQVNTVRPSLFCCIEPSHRPMRACPPHVPRQTTILGLLGNLQTVINEYASCPPRLKLDEYLRMLEDHNMYRASTVRIKEADTGKGVGRPQTIQLTAAASRTAFMLASGTEGRLHPAHSIDAAQLAEALVRCGEAKFEPISAMGDTQRGEAGLLQLLGLADEAAIITSSVIAKAADRFDFANAPPLPSATEAERAAWLCTWPRIDLSMLPGFPDWDAPVHNILQKNFADLVSIFCFYAKQGGADAGGAGWRSLDDGEFEGMLDDLVEPLKEQEDSDEDIEHLMQLGGSTLRCALVRRERFCFRPCPSICTLCGAWHACCSAPILLTHRPQCSRLTCPSAASHQRRWTSPNSWSLSWHSPTCAPILRCARYTRRPPPATPRRRPSQGAASHSKRRSLCPMRLRRCWTSLCCPTASVTIHLPSALSMRRMTNFTPSSRSSSPSLRACL
jgi:hypothetical protein